VQVINTGQAFAITSQNVANVVWAAGSNETITWDVGGSDLAPISTPLVNILLSTDGGQTFPITLASQVSNNGSYQIQVPFVNTSTARVMVEGDGNIFFDINDRNFTIGITAVAELTQPFEVIVAPNPTDAYFQITLPKDQYQYGLRLYDLKGKLMMVRQIEGNQSKVDVANIPTGAYFYRIMRNDGAFVNGKLMIQ
jgi:hypothetical protein